MPAELAAKTAAAAAIPGLLAKAEDCPLTTGSRKDTDTSWGSLPTFCRMAELFLASRMDCSSSVRVSECWSPQWDAKDLAQPKLSLQMKHISIGFTGTTFGRVGFSAGSLPGTLEASLSSRDLAEYTR